VEKRVPYDDFADIYDAWCESAPIAAENKKFYVDLMTGDLGPVVELGVGNGRICIEVAKRGRQVFGVDSSTRILELCHQRAEKAGVTDRLTLIHADFRDFELPEAARLITIPFHSIGHLMTREDRETALRNIRRQLVPGGQFVFDHFIFDPEYPVPSGTAFLRAEVTDPETGRERLIWETSNRDMSRQVIHLVVCTEDLNENGEVLKRRYRRSDLSWVTPEESRSLLEETGFEIESVYGDFKRAPLSERSPEQIWVARRPSE
jgi:ubiquinone/menaquinone biosynthesis C-methylase UbiE